MMTTIASIQAQLDALGVGDILQPRDLAGVREWSLVVTGELEHSRGVSWTGVLTHSSGVTVGVENAGDGGCNDYSGDRAARELFTKQAKDAFPEESEPEDLLVLFIEIVG